MINYVQLVQQELDMLKQLPSTMSKLYLFLAFLSITSLLIAEQASAQAPTQPNYFFHVCRSSFGNYTANSTYESNLKTVLSDLQDHGSSEFFYNTSSGSGSDTVYGQYYCRGDIDSTLCGDCIQQAAESIIRNCTLFESSIIWYEECTLRYSNQSMVGIEAEFPKSWAQSLSNVSDSETLVSVLNSTLDKLIIESTQGSKPSLFATGDEPLSAFESVYCLVQCSPDLNGTQCESCLRSTYAFIPTCCGTMAKQVAVFYASCQLRYSTFRAFYKDKNAAPTPRSTPALASPPPPTDTPTSSVPFGRPGTTVTDPVIPPAIITSASPTGASVGLSSSGIGLVMTALAFLVLVVKT